MKRTKTPKENKRDLALLKAFLMVNDDSVSPDFIILFIKEEFKKDVLCLHNKQNSTWALGDISISHSFAALTRSISI